MRKISELTREELERCLITAISIVQDGDRETWGDVRNAVSFSKEQWAEKFCNEYLDSFAPVEAK